MEKLSSILPSNARVKSVDLEDAHPIRPGTPSLGRPVGITSSQRDRLTISPRAKEAAFNETLARRNPREEKSVKIVQSVTDNFFNNRVGPKTDSSQAALPLSEEMANSEFEKIASAELSNLAPAYPPAEAASGQFVDKNA